MTYDLRHGGHMVAEYPLLHTLEHNNNNPLQHFLSVYFFSVSFCPCLPGPLGLDKLPPTSPPCPLTA